jgi:hypothetical protein
MVAAILVPALEVVAAMPAACPAYTAAADSQDSLLSKHRIYLGWQNIYRSPLAGRTEDSSEALGMTVVVAEHRLDCCRHLGYRHLYYRLRKRQEPSQSMEFPA